VGPGLPFFGFRDKSFSWAGLSTLLQFPAILEVQCFSVRVFSLSWLVPILKRRTFALRFCMT
jgi:hypothetical protein